MLHLLRRSQQVYPFRASSKTRETPRRLHFIRSSLSCQWSSVRPLFPGNSISHFPQGRLVLYLSSPPHSRAATLKTHARRCTRAVNYSNEVTSLHFQPSNRSAPITSRAPPIAALWDLFCFLPSCKITSPSPWSRLTVNLFILFI